MSTKKSGDELETKRQPNASRVYEKSTQVLAVAGDAESRCPISWCKDPETISDQDVIVCTPFPSLSSPKLSVLQGIGTPTVKFVVSTIVHGLDLAQSTASS